MMYKNSKAKKTSTSLPLAPLLDQIKADIETYNIGTATIEKLRQIQEEAEADSLDVWWYLLESLINDLKELQILNDEIQDSKIKLQQKKAEFEAQKNEMKEIIENQKQIFKSIL